MAQRKIEECTATPFDIKSIHRDFRKGNEHDYTTLSHHSRLDVNRQIKSIRDSDLQQVIDLFPLEEELPSQCANWIHALTGKHFFPDANHRTSIATLRQILSDNQVSELVIWDQEVLRERVKSSKEARNNVSVNMGNLYQKDELYGVWYDYFEDYCEIA